MEVSMKKLIIGSAVGSILASTVVVILKCRKYYKMRQCTCVSNTAISISDELNSNGARINCEINNDSDENRNCDCEKEAT